MAHRLYRRAAMTAGSLTVLVMAGAAQAQTIQSRDCRYEPNYPIAAPYWVDQNGCMRMRSGNQDLFVTGTVAPRAAGPAAVPGTVSQAQVRRVPDCRYDPHRQMASPYWVDQNGCLRMRQGGQDVFVTGSVVGAPTGAPRGGIGLPPAGGVSPVADGPRGPRGPSGANPPGINPPGGNPPAGNPPAGNPPAGNPPAGTTPVVDDGDDDRPGNGHGKDRSAKNNNGLGNGWDPGDIRGDVSYAPGDSNTDLAKGSDPSNPAHGSGDGPGKGKGNGSDKGNGNGKN